MINNEDNVDCEVTEKKSFLLHLEPELRKSLHPLRESARSERKQAKIASILSKNLGKDVSEAVVCEETSEYFVMPSANEISKERKFHLIRKRYQKSEKERILLKSQLENLKIQECCNCKEHQKRIIELQSAVDNAIELSKILMKELDFRIKRQKSAKKAFC